MSRPDPFFCARVMAALPSPRSRRPCPHRKRWILVGFHAAAAMLAVGLVVLCPPRSLGEQFLALGHGDVPGAACPDWGIAAVVALVAMLAMWAHTAAR